MIEDKCYLLGKFPTLQSVDDNEDNNEEKSDILFFRNEKDPVFLSGNCAIPDTVPEYYFEITITNIVPPSESSTNTTPLLTIPSPPTTSSVTSSVNDSDNTVVKDSKNAPLNTLMNRLSQPPNAWYVSIHSLRKLFAKNLIHSFKNIEKYD
jgi:hypothetical protein